MSVPSEIDTRRQVAEGTNYMEAGASDTLPTYGKNKENNTNAGGGGRKMKGGASGFTMDAEAERELLEDFKRSDPNYGKRQQEEKDDAGAKKDPNAAAGVRFNSFRPDMSIDSAREKEINDFIAARQTWRANVPVARWFEYWRLRADFYPYVKQSDAQENFFLRGITCHPRLSEFPTCKEVIRDYFTCRDEAKLWSVANSCAPLKEQLSACINMVFVRNHERGDKKFNATREAKFEELREKKFKKMLQAADSSIKSRDGFRD